MDDVLPMRPAGFWIRAVALAIDVVVCALVQMSFGVLGRVLMGSAGDDSSAHSTAFLFTAIFAAAYWTTLHMVAGQTLGKTSSASASSAPTARCSPSARPSCATWPRACRWSPSGSAT